MDSAAARKERLKALKAQAEASPAGADGQPIVEPQLKFRNYQPTSKKIEHEVLAPAAPPVYQEPAPAPEETAANGQVRVTWLPLDSLPCFFNHAPQQAARFMASASDGSTSCIVLPLTSVFILNLTGFNHQAASAWETRDSVSMLRALTQSWLASAFAAHICFRLSSCCQHLMLISPSVRVANKLWSWFSHSDCHL